MKIEDTKVQHDFLNGVITGKDVRKSIKYYGQAKSFYKSVDSNLQEDTVMYEVYTYTEAISETDGKLNYGLTVLQPVCVHSECNMTRGHFHENLECDEIYCCMHGTGLLLFMDENNQCHAQRMRTGSVHYIDGHLAHRLINIGDEELKVQCIWPTNAGHDYKRIEKHPFPVRVYKVNGEIKVEEEK